MGTLKFENYWVNPKTDLVDPHRTKNGQNAPSCTVLNFWPRNFLKLPFLPTIKSPIYWQITENSLTQNTLLQTFCFHWFPILDNSVSKNTHFLH